MDIHFEILDDEMADVLRKKTPQERLRIAFSLWTSTRKQLTAYLRSLHPDWEQEKIQREVARRMSHGCVENDA